MQGLNLFGPTQWRYVVFSERVEEATNNITEIRKVVIPNRVIAGFFVLKFGKRTRCETGVIVYFTKKDEFSVFFAFFNDFHHFYRFLP